VVESGMEGGIILTFVGLSNVSSCAAQ